MCLTQILRKCFYIPNWLRPRSYSKLTCFGINRQQSKRRWWNKCWWSAYGIYLFRSFGFVLSRAIFFCYMTSNEILRMINRKIDMGYILTPHCLNRKVPSNLPTSNTWRSFAFWRWLVCTSQLGNRLGEKAKTEKRETRNMDQNYSLSRQTQTR